REASGAFLVLAKPARGRAPLDRALAHPLRLGAGLLSSAPRQRPHPRLRLALPGPALAQDPLENVADRHPLRRSPAHPQPNQTRLLAHQPATTPNRLNHAAKSKKSLLENRE